MYKVIMLQVSVNFHTFTIEPSLLINFFSQPTYMLVGSHVFHALLLYIYVFYFYFFYQL